MFGGVIVCVYAKYDPDDTFFCGSRPNTRLHFDSDLTTFQDVTPYSEFYNNHPYKLVAATRGWRKVQVGTCAWTGKTEERTTHVSEICARVHTSKDWLKA